MAVDENTGIWGSGGATCAMYAGWDFNPWWVADMGKEHYILEVIVSTKADYNIHAWRLQVGNTRGHHCRPPFID